MESESERDGKNERNEIERHFQVFISVPRSRFFVVVDKNSSSCVNGRSRRRGVFVVAIAIVIRFCFCFFSHHFLCFHTTENRNSKKIISFSYTFCPRNRDIDAFFKRKKLNENEWRKEMCISFVVAVLFFIDITLMTC